MARTYKEPPLTRTQIVAQYHKALAEADARFYEATEQQRIVRDAAMADAEAEYHRALSLLRPHK